MMNISSNGERNKGLMGAGITHISLVSFLR